MKKMILFVNMIVVFTLVTTAAHAMKPMEEAKKTAVELETTATDKAKQATDVFVKKIESKYICMVNNRKFAKEQIPVEVNGKTYYGCCEMCKSKLQASEELRTAIDPVTGVKLDKADAVAAANEAGEVFYFESEENIKKFNEKKISHEKHEEHGEHDIKD